MSKNQPHVDNPIRIIAACRNSDGGPDFAAVMVDCSPDAVRDGAHFELAAAKLEGLGYQEPYIFFDQSQAPKWLTAGVLASVEIVRAG
jgi:hypothetical protein